MVGKTNLFLKSEKKGVSLIEVIIVLTILALIAVFMIASLNPQAKISQGKDARRKTDLKRIQIAFEDFYADHNCYPTPPLICGKDFKPYIDSIPCDPDGGNYFYSVPNVPNACPQFFRIYSYLNSSSDLDIVKLGCQNGCGPAGADDYDYGVSSTNVALEKGTVLEPTTVPSQPTLTSTPVPPGGSYYGCFNCKCESLPGPICSPNYQQEFCYDQCKNCLNECK